MGPNITLLIVRVYKLQVRLVYDRAYPPSLFGLTGLKLGPSSATNFPRTDGVKSTSKPPSKSEHYWNDHFPNISLMTDMFRVVQRTESEGLRPRIGA